MWETFLEFVDALGTPLLAVIAWVVWRIKVNDLPHIERQIANLQGRMETKED